MKDWNWSEIGSSMDSEIWFWSWHFPESGLSTREWGIAAEEDVGDDGYEEGEQWACVAFVYACGGDHTRQPDVDGVSVTGVFDDFGDDVAERIGKSGEFLVGKMEKFISVKIWTKWWEMHGDLHVKVGDVGVIGTVEDVLGSVK